LPGLEECLDPPDCPRARLAPLSQVEHDARVVHHLTTEARRWDIHFTKESFNVPKKMHRIPPIFTGDSA
jgi:hypothetical protein